MELTHTLQSFDARSDAEDMSQYEVYNVKPDFAAPQEDLQALISAEPVSVARASKAASTVVAPGDVEAALAPMADKGRAAVGAALTVDTSFKPGINFYDIQPLLRDWRLRDDVAATLHLALLPEGHAVRGIVGIESRGFLFGLSLADAACLPFFMLRKAGKTPGAVVRSKAPVAIEYSSGGVPDHAFEFTTAHGLPAGAEVVLVDDVLATGGSLKEAAALLAEAGLRVVASGVVVEISGLGGAAKAGHPVWTVWRSPPA